MITRKCGFKDCNCKDMSINKNNINEYIYFDKKTYHLECFEKLIANRIKQKRTKERWSKINEDFSNIKKDSYLHFTNLLIKDDLYEFILNNYNVTIVTNNVFVKIDNIASGKLPGMSVAIPREDLLDMWERKIKYLNKINNKNIAHGKIIDGCNRIIYDLSILIGLYDSYINWKREKEVNENEIKEIKNETNLTKIIPVSNSQNNDNEQDDDLSDLVNEIFG